MNVPISTAPKVLSMDGRALTEDDGLEDMTGGGAVVQPAGARGESEDGRQPYIAPMVKHPDPGFVTSVNL